MKKSMSGRSGAAAVVLSILAAVTLGGCASAEDVPTGPNGEDEAEASVSTTQEALSGLTCRDSATDDRTFCEAIHFWSCYSGSNAGACRANAEALCARKYAQAGALCDNDVARVYRVLQNGFHNETKVFAGGTVEDVFSFFPRRYTGADPNPIYRCPVDPSGVSYVVYSGGIRDFPSKSATCEGKGTPISILGYSLPLGVKGATAVYRCRAGSDHFMSRDANCEGKVKEGLLGYANSN